MVGQVIVRAMTVVSPKRLCGRGRVPALDLLRAVRATATSSTIGQARFAASGVSHYVTALIVR